VRVGDEQVEDCDETGSEHEADSTSPSEPRSSAGTSRLNGEQRTRRGVVSVCPGLSLSPAAAVVLRRGRATVAAVQGIDPTSRSVRRP
jgi:hypothetical protein